ncbi:acyltransferase [Neptuniibacter sp.]|uniref:acyltransferase family protein n=1 Tax=Neptuniibacter sp. TaxID=1962643 RepID=UPI00261DB252|nr:acyltransferase [Neptuniibacter sp.]MCP4598624.1 acyltransferase [Neptuniibacter sp.]
MSTSLQTPSQRLLHLDALRGIAVLLVVVQHTVEHFAMWRVEKTDFAYPLYDLIHSVDTGRMGVVIFFAISGFVIPLSLRGSGWSGFKGFAIKRFFRLFPAYWLSIPFGVLTTWWFYDKHIPLQDVVLNLSMLPQLVGYQAVIGLYWTLELELIFYFLLGCLFLAGLHNRILVIAFFCMGLALFRLYVTEPELAQIIKVEINRAAMILEYAQYLAVMFFGALSGFCFRENVSGAELKSIRFWFPAMLIVVAWLLLMVRPFNVFIMGLEQENLELIRYGLPVVLAVLLFILWISILKLRTVWLVWLGVISYSLYLFHPVAIYMVDKFVCQPDLDTNVCQSSFELGLTGYIVCSFSLALTMAYMVYRWIEMPAISAGKRIYRQVLDQRR